MFDKTSVARGLLIAFGGAGCGFGAAWAQATPDAPKTAPEVTRIEITGSAIRRIDAESAVPVTVLKFEELRAQGLSTVEQVLATITAMQSALGTSQVVGAGTGGAAAADLRGIGPNKTLILLNGRRIANNAILASAPDLNTIPFAALERVEVLRDGASALYGTDAIGGVINFITRKDMRGGSITLGADSPQHAGGKAYNANVGYGFGDLATDHMNVFAFIDVQSQDSIKGSQRNFGAKGRTSGVTFPATYFQGDGDSANPAAPACAAKFLAPSDATNCRYRTMQWIDYSPKSERTSGMLRGTFQFSENHALNVEYFATKSTVTASIAPVPYGALTVNPGTKYYPGNGITPAPPVGIVIDPTQPINVLFRDEPNGGRVGQTDNVQQRLVLSLEGALAGWDYQAGLAFNQNRINDKLIGGFTDGNLIAAGVSSGIINPFGAQSAAGQAALNAAAVSGTLQTANGTVSSLDARASREVGDWLGAGRSAALALGAELRSENFKDIGNPPFDQLVIASTGFDPATDNRGKRSVSAVFVELNVPILKSLEVTAAGRYDRYSDFGNSTNPKFSFRYQPVQQALLRGSYSTGFRAPSLFELNASQSYTNTGNQFDDPIRCPNGVPIAGAPVATNCKTQFLSLIGGNKALKPEKAKNMTLGIVLEPVADTSLGLDFWWVRSTLQIGGLADTTIFGDPVKYAALFHRAPDGSLSTDGSKCPGPNCGYVSLITDNLGGINTHGIDISATWRLRTADFGIFKFGLNSTYVAQYEYQNEPAGAWIQNVGVYSGVGPVFRWQHLVNTSWALGGWAAGLTGHFRSGYLDQKPTRSVGGNTTVDVYGTWQATKTLNLNLGVRNLFDRDPPFSNQAATFQQGYDPRFADATGRTYYVRGSYNF